MSHKYLHHGMVPVLSEGEDSAIQQALDVLTPRRVRRAFAAYNEERKFVDGVKAKPFMRHVCEEPERRGLSLLQVQLINVTAAQSWSWFASYLNSWIKTKEAVRA